MSYVTQNVLNDFLRTIDNPNSKKVYDSLINQLVSYCDTIEKDIQLFTKTDIDSFFRTYYACVSITTISNRMSQIKKIFKYKKINKYTVVKHLSLSYIGSVVEIRECRIYSPSEIKEAVESLTNAIDKALIILIFHGLYDKDFKTIINLRKSDVCDGYILNGNNRVNLPEYCMDILRDCISQESYYRNNENDIQQLCASNYLIRSIKHSNSRDFVSPIFIRKRLFSISEFLGDDEFTAIAIKNSKYAYDFIQTELVESFADRTSINELKDYCNRNNIKMYIERISIAKERAKEKIINEINNNMDLGLCR